MSDCKTLNPLLFFKTAKNWYDDELCCWESPTRNYNYFLTALTHTYNQECKQDKVFSDYVTQLFTDCLSGSSSSHTHTSDVYWTGNTDGSISPSGTSKYVGIGTDTPDKSLHVRTAENTVAVFESSDATAAVKIKDSSDDAYLVAKNSMLYISKSSGSPSSNAEFAFDYVNGRLGIGTTSMDEALVVAGSISAITNAYVSGRTYVGTVDAAGGSYSNDEILVRQSTGEIEYLTASQLAQSVVYWSANTDGSGSISNSGLTSTAVGIGTDKPSSLFEVKSYISFPENPSVFVGHQAGKTWEINSNYNTGLGQYACGGGTFAGMSGADNNTGIGFASLGNLTTGDNNIGLGTQTAGATNVGNHNIAIGNTSLFMNTNNSYQIAIGAEALYNTELAGGGIGAFNADTHNIAIGYRSQHYGYKSRYNVSIGSKTLGNGAVVSPMGTGNTVVGHESMKISVGADFNVAVGYKAGDNVTTANYNILIGHDADPPSATADYQMNIGGIIYGNDKYGESKISNVGVGYDTPKTVLDVHHSGNDLSSMANDTGGGEVVYFGENSGVEGQNCVAGKLMYFHTDGVWYPTDADAVATGGSQLLGICLGATTTDSGMLIRGFFDMHTYLAEPGAFKGLPMYVDVSAGAISSVAPAGSGDYVRVVGYGTITENVIYFNPDPTWVELT